MHSKQNLNLPDSSLRAMPDSPGPRFSIRFTTALQAPTNMNDGEAPME